MKKGTKKESKAVTPKIRKKNTPSFSDYMGSVEIAETVMKKTNEVIDTVFSSSQVTNAARLSADILELLLNEDRGTTSLTLSYLMGVFLSSFENAEQFQSAKDVHFEMFRLNLKIFNALNVSRGEKSFFNEEGDESIIQGLLWALNERVDAENPILEIIRELREVISRYPGEPVLLVIKALIFVTYSFINDNEDPDLDKDGLRDEVLELIKVCLGSNLVSGENTNTKFPKSFLN